MRISKRVATHLFLSGQPGGPDSRVASSERTLHARPLHLGADSHHARSSRGGGPGPHGVRPDPLLRRHRRDPRPHVPGHADHVGHLLRRLEGLIPLAARRRLRAPDGRRDRGHMSNPSRADHRKESGQALVEFILVLPILILLLLAIVDFSKAYNYWNDQNDLAHQAARYAAVGKNPGGTTQNLATFIKSKGDSAELTTGNGTGEGVQGNGAKVCVNVPAGAQVGDPVTVTVTTSYKWLSLIGSAVGVNKTIEGKAQMRLERV